MCAGHNDKLASAVWLNMFWVFFLFFLIKQKIVLILPDVPLLSVCCLLENVTGRLESRSTSMLSLWLLRILAGNPSAGKLYGINADK